MSRAEETRHAAALYKAVQKYVEAFGGGLVVIGGITIQKWPQDNKGIFHVAVKCLGREPKKPSADPIPIFRKRRKR